MPAKSKPKKRKSSRVKKSSRASHPAAVSEARQPVNLPQPQPEPQSAPEPQPESQPAPEPQSQPTSQSQPQSQPQSVSEISAIPDVASTEENIEEAFAGETGDELAKKRNFFVFFVGVGAGIALSVATVVVFVIYLRSPKVPTVATPEVETTPAPTPTPFFVRSEITFEVLNASGVSGAAADAGDKLTDVGYTVISLGNAQKQATSELFLSPSVASATATELLSEMQSIFSIASPSGSIGDEGVPESTASALLILGVK
jgi:hypothetical protein